MKILVAVDGSRYTKRMLGYLTAHDELLGNRHAYTMLTIVAPLPGRALTVLDKEAVANYYQEEAEKVFKPIRTFFERRGMRAEYVTKVGAAGDLIASTAEKGGYELLIMGSHGHGALRGLVMGSVASKVLANCNTPVLLIR